MDPNQYYAQYAAAQQMGYGYPVPGQAAAGLYMIIFFISINN